MGVGVRKESRPRPGEKAAEMGRGVWQGARDRLSQKHSSSSDLVVACRGGLRPGRDVLERVRYPMEQKSGEEGRERTLGRVQEDKQGGQETAQ